MKAMNRANEEGMNTSSELRTNQAHPTGKTARPAPRGIGIPVCSGRLQERLFMCEHTVQQTQPLLFMFLLHKSIKLAPLVVRQQFEERLQFLARHSLDDLNAGSLPWRAVVSVRQDSCNVVRGIRQYTTRHVLKRAIDRYSVCISLLLNGNRNNCIGQVAVGNIQCDRGSGE